MSTPQRPLQWLDSAAPAEIAEALLAVDTGKAAAVALYITERFGAELGAMANQFDHDMAQRPLQTVGRVLEGAMRGFLRRS